MNNREDSLLEIYERIKEKRISLGLTSFKRTPTEPIIEKDMPCLFMLEGPDNIIDRSGRSNIGYPVRRVLEVTLELVTTKDVDIKSKLRDLRKAVFTERGSNPAVYNPRLVPTGQTGFIQENRTDGPTGYGLHDVLGMSLILDLIYTDDIL
jgi:hypothetical protein